MHWVKPHPLGEVQKTSLKPTKPNRVQPYLESWIKGSSHEHEWVVREWVMYEEFINSKTVVSHTNKFNY